MKVRILDTPGLADSRGFQQDELHKKSIATQVKDHINSITAVLIIANGTLPRMSAGTDYALTTLTALFPKTLATNIGFLFTNVSTPLHLNFSRDGATLKVLETAPQFLLDNPIALQRKYLEQKEGPKMKNGRPGLRKAVKAGERNALKTLVDLFNWWDSLKPQLTMDIVHLYDMSQTIEAMITNTLAQMDQAATKKAEIMSTLQSNPNVSFSLCSYLGLNLFLLDIGYECFPRL